MSPTQRQSRQEPTQSPPRSQSTTSPSPSGPSHKSPPRQSRQQQAAPAGAVVQSPGSSATGRARDRGTQPARGVYWSDEANPSQYTFYREGTPTPPEYAGDEEKNVGGRIGSAGGASAAAAAAAALETARSIEPKEPRPAKITICGMRRWVFWLLVALVLLVIGIGVGVGVGVGVGRHRSGGSTTRSSTTTTSIPSSTSTTSSGARSTTASSSAAGTSSAPGCPAVNNTIYDVPGSDKRFLRLCGLDYSGIQGAVDISHVPTSSFAECMNNCAGTVGCSGCSWGPLKGDEEVEHRCWLKSTLQGSHRVEKTWSFAILQ